MSPEAINKFRQTCKLHNAWHEFADAVALCNRNIDKYLNNTPAIYAVRRVADYYDGSVLARLATAWETVVVLNRLDPSLEEDIKTHGAEQVIKAIRFAQQQGEWNIPNKLCEPVSEDAPLPIMPEVPIVESDSTDDFQFIDLSPRSGKRSSTDEYHIRLHFGKSGNYLLLNPTLSNNIRTSKCTFMRLRRDTLTNELHLVFSRTDDKGSVAITEKKGGHSIIVTSKVLCQFLYSTLRLTGDNNELRVSKNMSHVDDKITIKIIKD